MTCKLRWWPEPWKGHNARTTWPPAGGPFDSSICRKKILAFKKARILVRLLCMLIIRTNQPGGPGTSMVIAYLSAALRKRGALRMKTIVVANQKGGSGKSTVTVHLAVAAEQAGDGP